jgi:DnaJ domain
MEGVLLGLCFGSCLKGEGTNNLELYETLGFDNKHVTQEQIRLAFRKLTLQLHPDKLAQRGIKATPEDSMKFVKAKEAHDILSDPKRRRRYDQLGLLGLKIIENPREMNPSELLKNFKRNQRDRYKISLVLGVLFCFVLIFPILFSLKCDGTIPNAPWLAIWTPMWFVDLLLFMAACALCAHKEEVNEEEQKEPIEKVTSPLHCI